MDGCHLQASPALAFQHPRQVCRSLLCVSRDYQVSSETEVCHFAGLFQTGNENFSRDSVCIRRKLGSERFRVGQTQMKNPTIQVHVREGTEGHNITVRVWMGYVSVTYGDTHMDGGQEETFRVRELFDISLVVISSRCLTQH